MDDAGQGSAADGKALELRTKYLLSRLDHTLTHTQTASRLIYVVDGAVLALIYFAVRSLGTSPQVILLVSFPTLLLAGLNALHARFVILQREHYHAVDSKLRQLLNTGDLEFRRQPRYFASAHGIYCWMHGLVAVFLAVAAGAMILYGIGWFPALEVPKAVGLASM